MRRMIGNMAGLAPAMALLAAAQHAKTIEAAMSEEELQARTEALRTAQEERDRIRAKERVQLRKSQQSSKNAAATRGFLDAHKKPKLKRR